VKRIAGDSQSMDATGVYGHDADGDLERAAGIPDGIFGTLLK